MALCQRIYPGFNGRASSKSTGLGLYLTKLILDKLAITIAITSQLDIGTEVRISKES